MSRLSGDYEKQMSDRQMAIIYNLKSYAGIECHCGSVEKMTYNGQCLKCNRSKK